MRKSFGLDCSSVKKNESITNERKQYVPFTELNLKKSCNLRKKERGREEDRERERGRERKQ
jgi:hypothetical protein